MRILVVDDEEPARKRLIRMLAEIADTEVVGQAEDGETALAAINQLKPDVVLLDVQMPKMSGLLLATQSTELPPIIFVTAHQEFAVQAFDVNAVDYLLKPVRAERLVAALERVKQRATLHPAAATNASQAQSRHSSSRIFAGARGEVKFFEATSICRFWAADKYTLFLADGQEQMTEEPLTSLEERLRGLGFVRTHRAELIQLSKVKSLKSIDGFYEVTLADGQVSKVSRRSLQDVKTALGI
jgi:DNA-binding LytR/AlgR family response regulator